jgi:hypothetical protein
MLACQNENKDLCKPHFSSQVAKSHSPEPVTNILASAVKFSFQVVIKKLSRPQ